CITANERQLFTRRPLTCTVHAPHCPWSHPFFVPVRWMRSRSVSSSVARVSSPLSLYCLPLMRRVTVLVPALSAASCAAGATDGAACTSGAAPASKPVAPSPERNDLLLNRLDLPDSGVRGSRSIDWRSGECSSGASSASVF